MWQGGDRYSAHIIIPGRGDFTYAIESYDNPLATWLHDAEVKIAAKVDSELMCLIGAALFEEVIAHDSSAKSLLKSGLAALNDKKLSPEAKFDLAAAPEIRSYFTTHPLRRMAEVSEKFPIRADHPRALVGAWYEFFPRSEGAIAHKDGTVTSGTFATAAKRIPAVAAMGFDVIYLPPIHPIGSSHRKGRNNTLTPTESDPGVPWAIGNKDGGHMAINSALGTMKDFQDFLAVAKKSGISIALDFALQA